MTTAEMLRAEGRAEGEAQGRVGILDRMLTTKFGPLSPEATERINTASTSQLDAWAERAIAAANLDELLR